VAATKAATNHTLFRPHPLYAAALFDKDHSRPSHLARVPDNVGYPPKVTKLVQRHE